MIAHAGIEALRAKSPAAIIDETRFHDEITLTIDKEHLVETLKILMQNPSPGYDTLVDFTGVDYLEPQKMTKVVYLLQNPQTLQRLRLAVIVKRNEKIPTIVSLWRGADWYERELFDLFGVEFEGRSSTERILMPDDWHGHPLRKDYALTEEPVEFKHGVKPKVPSEIIPNVKRIQKS
ncbi:MAG: NADH-quinone oxidoreductase subunit C [Parachlamydiaceae bacterium]|nr:NADH-quinone oxidoreductase subunit C [Parachlamydiaceae bacterium]